MESFHTTATACSAAGMAVPVPQCITAQMQQCGEQAADMQTKCEAAGRASDE
jgi:hypothetical protein